MGGGVPVPAIARWPGNIEANSVISTPLWSLDILVASVILAGAELPRELLLDGKNPLPVLTGKTTVSPHETFFFQYALHAALRWSDWKIVRTHPEQSWQLFNLNDDLGETKNRAAEKPDLVAKLDAAFRLKQDEIIASNKQSDQ